MTSHDDKFIQIPEQKRIFFRLVPLSLFPTPLSLSKMFQCAIYVLAYYLYAVADVVVTQNAFTVSYWPQS